MGENPTTLTTLDDLPPRIRTFAEHHLRERLGGFYSQLRFAGGNARAARDPDRRRTDFVCYELRFSFSRPEDGIAEYTALLGHQAVADEFAKT